MLLQQRLWDLYIFLSVAILTLAILLTFATEDGVIVKFESGCQSS